MLGSNWMDRGDAFFDYCSLHHQNSLTCLFMLRSENIVPVTLYNNNVSAVCWHNKTKATQIASYNRIPISHCCLPESHWEETRTFYSQTILYIVLIGLMDCLRECIRWTRIVGTSLIIPIILVSANLLLHLLEDQWTFSSSEKYLLVITIYLSKNFQKSMYFKWSDLSPESDQLQQTHHILKIRPQNYFYAFVWTIFNIQSNVEM